MSDATDYLMAHAVQTTLEARQLLPSELKTKLRRIGRIYHLLAKEGAYGFNIPFLDDYRAAKAAEERLCSKAPFQRSALQHYISE
jgi:hypothetical protein